MVRQEDIFKIQAKIGNLSLPVIVEYEKHWLELTIYVSIWQLDFVICQHLELLILHPLQKSICYKIHKNTFECDPFYVLTLKWVVNHCSNA